MAWLISLGGLAIIAAVLGILLFIGKEALPLARSARSESLGTLRLPAAGACALEESGKALAALDPAEGIRLLTLPDGASLGLLQEGPARPWRAWTAPDAKGSFAILDREGLLRTGQIQWEKPAAEPDPHRWSARVEWGEAISLPPGATQLIQVRAIAAGGLDGAQTLRIAALDPKQRLLWCEVGPGVAKPEWAPLGPDDATTALWTPEGHEAVVGTRTGRLLLWDPVAGISEAEAAFPEPIQSLGFALGQVSILVGGARGGLEAVQILRKEGQARLQPFHRFAAHPGPVLGFVAGARDKRFLSWSAGLVTVDHLTTEQRLFRASNSGISNASLSSRGDFIAALGPEGVQRWHLDAPHPEVSLRTLWRKVHYEGYERPEHAWQSSGGSDDFEPKLGLVPLLFGTLKGTLFALVFALPLAILGALYTSQFASHRFRNLIKPAIEIMAALPSVVLGFLAGLVLAPLFETSAIQLLLWPVFTLLAAMGLLPFWGLIPKHHRSRWTEGRELLFLAPVIGLGLLLSLGLAPGFERHFLMGDFRAWLLAKQGLTYDQRNALVVGFAMGFAVIPIIFTLSEDALSSVPKALRSASLACGASPWQTAWRVILPTASPGIFSAVMVGFGRAIGETMIVLMATGNTPVLDWSPFNGMRTLAANIAVETPEAPLHGTLYRVLFLTAFLLFLLTFLLNTLAELVRQHLRKRYESY